MANRTVKYATSVHGTNPQYLIEEIVRKRIYESKYWKDCLLLTSARVLERAVDDLRYVGGTYGANVTATPFLCLVLKLLQIQPQKEIIYLFIDQSNFKYLRALGAFYLRLTGKPVEIYEKLEPLYNDYRKLRIMDNQRNFSLRHMDEFIDDLLREDKVFNMTLPRLTKRIVLEENRDIGLYRSELEEQNLIPTHKIEEEIELQKTKRTYRDRHSRDHHHRSHHDSHSYDSRRDHRQPPIKYSRSSRRQDDDYGEHRRSGARYERHDRPHRSHSSDRSRGLEDSEQPGSSLDNARKLSSKYLGSKNRFSKEEIASENAIRLKVGLKPLK